MTLPLSIDLHPRFRRLADYLAAQAPPGKLPGRQHIDPVDLRDILPWLALVDVVSELDGAHRYRMRLVGTEVVAIQGSDGTGKSVERVLPEEGAAKIAGYDEILRSKTPQYHKAVVAIPGRDHVHFQRVAFPLASDGEHVDMLIFVFVRDET